MNEKREKIYVGIIIALLIFTYYSRSLQSGDLQRLENHLHSIRNEISHDVSRIQHQVSQMQEEQRWWSRGNMEFESIGENLQEVTTEWRVRDYRDGERVYFHYLLPEEENFRQLEMEEVSAGLFRGVFQLEMTIEPEISVQYSGSSTTDRPYEVVEWAIQEERQTDFLRHYVSTEYSGERRTTKEELAHFARLKYELYHPVHINVRHREGNEPEYHINVFVDRYSPSPKYTLEKLELLLMNDGEKVKKEELDSGDEHERDRLHFHKNIPITAEAFDELLFQFTYDNGEVFERVVDIGNHQ